jgi:uncharacterized protein YbjT (DUF2867 family)
MTSANGRTGRHVIAELLALGLDVRALDVDPAVAGLKDWGVRETVAGDMLDRAVLARAVEGADTVIHVGPMGHAQTAMGMAVIDAARAAKVRHFVYISVIHPQIEYLLNHSAKAAVEDYLLRSRLDWTILQPQHYMQNVVVKEVVREGRFTLPYSMTRKLGFLDMRDLALVAAKVVTEPGHIHATYELCAADHLSGEEVAGIVGSVCGKEIRAEQAPLDAMLAGIAARMPSVTAWDDTADWLYRLFGYYDRYGIVGNPNVLSWLLGRAPTSFADYVARELAKPD